MAIQNTADLRKMLLESIEAVKEGTMDPRQAHAIGNLSSKVIQSAKLDLDVLKYNMLENTSVKAGEKVLQLVNNS